MTGLPPTDSQFDYSRPARTLLEASARRLAQHPRTDTEGQEDGHSAPAQHIALIVRFMAAYAAAAAAGTSDWASFSEVADMFTVDTVLITHDSGVYRGRQQVLRRLDQGDLPVCDLQLTGFTDRLASSCAVTLCQLCGTIADHSGDKAHCPPSYTVLSAGMKTISRVAHAAKFHSTHPEPVIGEPCLWRVVTTFKAGLGQVQIQNDFIITGSKIQRLRSTRL